jgi:hypothetical protein
MVGHLACELRLSMRIKRSSLKKSERLLSSFGSYTLVSMKEEFVVIFKMAVFVYVSGKEKES